MTTLLVVAASALLVGSADIRATRNYREASQVHFVAESAIAHAMQVVNGPGVVNFQNDVVTPWPTLFGSAALTFGPVGGYAYTVSAVSDPIDPVNWGRFVATATGPEGVRNVVAARVNRSNIPTAAPGAIYLSQDGRTDSTFNGDGFKIDGNDHLYTGGLASPNHPVPGLSTRNDTNTQEAINSLSSGQRDNVLGLGFIAGSPAVPSILTSPVAPSVAQLNQFAADLVARPGVVIINDSSIHGNTTFGTETEPQITYFNNSSGVVLGNGNASGAGIMIVEGDLTIQGSLEFKGLVIVRGRTRVDGTTTDSGNATLYGSLLTNDVNLTVGGSVLVNYSSQALGLANQASGGMALPAPVQLASLIDCSQAVAGTAGCP
ncbi:MAG: hypothetical protein E6J59_02180 [Deltaproteobacteria bacterium]|nr:MAG: hypothetical protein E6J59_02180 [Deltaproteobacteria bacterium]